MYHHVLWPITICWSFYSSLLILARLLLQIILNYEEQKQGWKPLRTIPWDSHIMKLHQKNTIPCSPPPDRVKILSFGNPKKNNPMLAPMIATRSLCSLSGCILTKACQQVFQNFPELWILLFVLGINIWGRNQARGS